MTTNRPSPQSLLLAILVASLPYYLFASSILLIACTLLAVVSLVKRGRFRWTLVDGLSWMILVYFGIEVIGLMFTDPVNMKEGTFTLEKHLSFLMLPIIFYQCKITTTERRMILIAFVVSCLCASLICVGANIYLSVRDYNTLFHQWQFSHSRLGEPIDMHPVYLSMYLCLSFYILFEMLRASWFPLGKSKQVAVVVGMIGLLLMIVQLGGRTITLGFGLTIMVVLIRQALVRRSLILFLITFLVPVVFVGLVALNPVVRTRFTDLLNNTSNSNYGSYFARTNLWNPGLEIIQKNILIGVGTGDGQAELDKQYILRQYQEGLGMNLHNQYLETLLTLGVVGLTGLLMIFGYQLLRSIRWKDSLYSWFIVIFLFGCATESMLNSNKGIVFFLVFSFIFFKSERNEITNPDQSPTSLKHHSSRAEKSA